MPESLLPPAPVEEGLEVREVTLVWVNEVDGRVGVRWERGEVLIDSELVRSLMEKRIGNTNRRTRYSGWGRDWSGGRRGAWRRRRA